MQKPAKQPEAGLSLLFVLAVHASWDPDLSIVHIPFDFYVGEHEMEQGTYIIRLEDNVLRLASQTKKSVDGCCRSVIIPATQTDSMNGTLVFVQYGRRYVLSKGFWPQKEPTDDMKEYGRAFGSTSLRALV